LRNKGLRFFGYESGLFLGVRVDHFSKNAEMVFWGSMAEPPVRRVPAAPIREPLLHLADGVSVMGVREICDEKMGKIAGPVWSQNTA